MRITKPGYPESAARMLLSPPSVKGESGSWRAALAMSGQVAGSDPFVQAAERVFRAKVRSGARRPRACP
ncbi:hypothetical protein Misp02_00260 [Microtetraspora sp. NBRC 16547]|nr:hypothetical protein Misp02_00260 [Microtetraspora sp. NBRC 16547]